MGSVSEKYEYVEAKLDKIISKLVVEPIIENVIEQPNKSP